jgi:hypothetical protein
MTRQRKNSHGLHTPSLDRRVDLASNEAKIGTTKRKTLVGYEESRLRS